MSRNPHAGGTRSRALSPRRRRTSYPDLGLVVNPPQHRESRYNHASEWPAWTDRQTVESEVDPILWPDLTDTRIGIAPPHALTEKGGT